MAVIADRALVHGQGCAIAMSDRFANGKRLAMPADAGAGSVVSGAMMRAGLVAAARGALTAMLRVGVSLPNLKADPSRYDPQ